jgi:hypothetical protein
MVAGLAEATPNAANESRAGKQPASKPSVQSALRSSRGEAEPRRPWGLGRPDQRSPSSPKPHDKPAGPESGRYQQGRYAGTFPVNPTQKPSNPPRPPKSWQDVPT